MITFGEITEYELKNWNSINASDLNVLKRKVIKLGALLGIPRLQLENICICISSEYYPGNNRQFYRIYIGLKEKKYETYFIFCEWEHEKLIVFRCTISDFKQLDPDELKKRQESDQLKALPLPLDQEYDLVYSGDTFGVLERKSQKTVKLNWIEKIKHADFTKPPWYPITFKSEDAKHAKYLLYPEKISFDGADWVGIISVSDLPVQNAKYFLINIDREVCIDLNARIYSFGDDDCLISFRLLDNRLVAFRYTRDNNGNYGGIEKHVRYQSHDRDYKGMCVFTNHIDDLRLGTLPILGDMIAERDVKKRLSVEFLLDELDRPGDATTFWALLSDALNS